MCADPLPRTPGTEKMAFPDTNSPLPLLSLVFRLSRFHSLELYKSLDVWGQGSVAAPMSRCLWAGLRHYTPGSSFGTSLRTHMKKVVLWCTNVIGDYVGVVFRCAEQNLPCHNSQWFLLHMSSIFTGTVTGRVSS